MSFLRKNGNLILVKKRKIVPFYFTDMRLGGGFRTLFPSGSAYPTPLSANASLTQNLFLV